MPLSRFDRDFELAIQVEQRRAVIIKPPMRIAFSADKSVSGGLNKITVKAYNLTEANRLAIQKDPEQQKRIPFSLRIGYSGSLELIFKGTVFKAKSRREGAEIVTEIEGLDGGFDFLNSYVNRTVRGKDSAVSGVLSALPNTQTGKITDQSPLIRPKVMVGSAMKVLDSLVDEGATWYVDDERLYILKQDDVVSRFIPLVSADTGLTNTPEREQSRVTFETLMNPALKIGGLCQLESVTAPHINGVYKIDSMGYSGDNYGNDWKQVVTAILAPAYRVL
jgi:hypothetical protein